MTKLIPFYENRSHTPLGVDALRPTVDGERYDFVLERLRMRNNLQRRKRGIGPGAIHDHYHIVMYLEGDARIAVCDELISCPAGSVVLTGPGDRHNLIPSSGGYRSIALTFHLRAGSGKRLQLPVGELLGALTSTRLPPLPTPVQLRANDANRLRLRFERLQERLLDHAGAVWAFHVSVAFLEIVEVVADAIHRPRATMPGRPDDRLERVRNTLNKQFRDRITVDQLASQAGMSKGYFLRAFKREYGISPIAYQLQLRIDAAKSLLLSTNLQIQEIAEDVGFDSIYYFSRMFKAATSSSPTQYRQADDL